jgi:hypothetical protein
MSDTKERLIEKFEHLKNEYKKAFKAKLIDVCRKIGTELFELVEQLRALGLKHTDLGLSPDFEYIVRSFELVAKNPTSTHADAIIADAKRCINGTCTSTERKFTMQGFDIIEIHPDGTRSYPEREPPKKIPEQPHQLPRRNCDIQREAGENTC